MKALNLEKYRQIVKDIHWNRKKSSEKKQANKLKGLKKKYYCCKTYILVQE